VVDTGLEAGVQCPRYRFWSSGICQSPLVIRRRQIGEPHRHSIINPTDRRRSTVSPSSISVAARLIVVSTPSSWFPDLCPSDERTALVQRLDHYRAIVSAQIADLDNAQAAVTPLESTQLSVGGIVKHLAWAEDHWFQGKFRGLPLPEPWVSAPLQQDPDWAFRFSADDSVDDLVALYSAAVTRSTEVVASTSSLDDIAVVSSFGVGPVNLRWILIHMVDETARHAGHLDILRDALLRHPLV
jgi:hypothetical protein